MMTILGVRRLLYLEILLAGRVARPMRPRSKVGQVLPDRLDVSSAP